jgi:ribosomal protein L24E
MNTNNMKIKTLSINEFKIYSDNGILKVKGNGQVFDLLSGKKIVESGRFFSTKDSEVLKFIQKLFRYVMNRLKENLDNDSVGKG